MHPMIVRNSLSMILVWAALAATARAAPHEVRIPLRDGKLHTPDLAAAICREMRLPAFNLPGGDIDVSGLGGSLFIRGVNAALGEGCRITVDRDALVLHVDAEKLPGDVDAAKRAVRVFTAEAAPAPTARQARHWGLSLPESIDDRHPLVVMIHGLDSSWGELSALGNLLKEAGYQVAYLSYPDGQPLADSARFLADHMADLRKQHPALKIDVIGHSLGGLVARDFIEGDDYHGGVDHLILIATPNAGSKWAAGELVLKVRRQYDQAKADPQWHWTWGITNGLGESAEDLAPHSKFLERLNARPRRTGVKYTIIVGDRSVVARVSANAVETAANSLPKKAQSWWGVRQFKSELEEASNRLRNATGTNDGLVSVESAKLAGVDDLVVLAADHATLVWPNHGNPPAAWPVIQDRLGR